GVPLRVPVPLPLSTNVTPSGRAVPLRVIGGVGVPVVVTVKVPAWPTVNLAALALVIASPGLTVSVKVWVALGVTALRAVEESVEVPPLPAAGLPLSFAVPSPLSTNVTPDGKLPLSVSVGVGNPVVVTVKLPVTCSVKAVALALVIFGACSLKKVSRSRRTPLPTSTSLAKKAPVAWLPSCSTSVPLGAYTLAIMVLLVPMSTAAGVSVPA